MPELDIDRVVTLFSLYSDLEGEALERWRGFCESAARFLCGRLREGVDPAGAMEELCACAAGIAYSDYLAVQSAGRMSDEIRVGDLSLRSSGSGGVDTGEIREHFLGRAAHLICAGRPALIATGGGS